MIAVGVDSMKFILSAPESINPRRFDELPYSEEEIAAIGGPFIWNLLRRAPDHIVAAVLAQPSGSRPEMRDLFYEGNMKSWGPADTFIPSGASNGHHIKLAHPIPAEPYLFLRRRKDRDWEEHSEAISHADGGSAVHPCHFAAHGTNRSADVSEPRHSPRRSDQRRVGH
jgi:hypothetical protein